VNFRDLLTVRGSPAEGVAIPRQGSSADQLGPCSQGKVREVEFFLHLVESLVSNHYRSDVPGSSADDIAALAHRNETRPLSLISNAAG